MLLVDKYKPESLDKIKGNKKQIDNLKSCVELGQSILIHGKVGIGKTAAVYALANDINYEVLEVNASESLHKSVIEGVVKSSAVQQSLFHKGKIILIDGIDCISGRTDYGGVPALVNLIKESKHPLVFIGNEIWDSKFSALRRKCKMIEFNELANNDIKELLKEICDKEKYDLNEEQLDLLVDSCEGDIRAAINDMQVIRGDDIKLEQRNKKDQIQNVLTKLFQGKGVKRRIFDDLDMDLNEVSLWIEENLPYVYSGDKLKVAFDYFSINDVFSGRILRNQYYRLLVYKDALLRLGVYQNERLRYNSFRRNDRILQMWIGKRKYASKKELAEKLALNFRCSVHKSMLEIPYLNNVLKDKEILNSLLS